MTNLPNNNVPNEPQSGPSTQPSAKKKRAMWPWIVGLFVVCGLIGAAVNGGGEDATATPAAVTSNAGATPIGANEAELAAEASASAEAEASESAEADASAKAEAEAEAEAAAAAEKEAKQKAEAEKEAKTEAKKKINNAKPMKSRELAKLVKKPDSYIGDVVVMYGEVTQFDAATGLCNFRANIAHTNMADSWDYEHNSMFEAGDGLVDCSALDEVVADDEVKITATVLGSYSYDTQIGGSTTVPSFKVEKISVL